MRAYWKSIWQQAKTETWTWAGSHGLSEVAFAGFGAIIAAIVSAMLAAGDISWNVVLLSSLAGAFGGPSVVGLIMLIWKMLSIPGQRDTAQQKEIKEKEAARLVAVKQLQEDSPVIDVYATPGHVDKGKVELSVQNTGKTPAHINLVECWVRDYDEAVVYRYYSYTQMFPLSPGGTDGKRDVRCIFRVDGPGTIDEHPCPLSHEEDGVVVQVHWSDTTDKRKWAGAPRFYSRQTARESSKFWDLTT